MIVIIIMMIIIITNIVIIIFQARPDNSSGTVFLVSPSTSPDSIPWPLAAPLPRASTNAPVVQAPAPQDIYIQAPQFQEIPSQAPQFLEFPPQAPNRVMPIPQAFPIQPQGFQYTSFETDWNIGASAVYPYRPYFPNARRNLYFPEDDSSFSNSAYDDDIIAEEEVEFYDAESDFTDDSFYVRDSYEGTRVILRERVHYDQRDSPYSSFDDYFNPAKFRPKQRKRQQIRGKGIKGVFNALFKCLMQLHLV